MQNFRDLQVWRRARELNLAIYKASAAFPREEAFGLTNQMRRCSVSICANIAEGCGRDGNAELSRFLQIARGSASELECHILLAQALGYLSAPQSHPIEVQIADLQRVLTILRQRALRSPRRPGFMTSDSESTTHNPRPKSQNSKLKTQNSKLKTQNSSETTDAH